MKTEKSLKDEEILKLLKTSASAKAAKKKKKAAEKAVAGEAPIGREPVWVRDGVRRPGVDGKEGLWKAQAHKK